MNNEKYQKTIEKYRKKKFLNKVNQKDYQADYVSPILFSLIKKDLTTPILDIGAGTGALVNYLHGKKYEPVQGIDLYPKKEFIKQGSITEIPTNNNVFNTVLCTEVIEHLSDQQIQEGLKEIKRVLKPQGTLILTVPNNENLEHNSYICPKCEHIFHKVGHLQSFDTERIKTLLEDADFIIISIKIYALGAMSKLPFGRYFNWLFLKLNYESISKRLMVTCKIKVKKI